MSPSMSHGAMTLLPRCSRVSSVRSFSTSTSFLRIGPESPRFIEVPRPPQQAASWHRDIKGKLPVPRDLFPRRAADKTSEEYFAKTTPEPSSDRSIENAPDSYVAYKRQLANTRRTYLRESLVALKQRKDAAVQQVAIRSAAKQNRREQLLNRPPRADEYLTASTIRSFNKLKQSGPPPDPRREERLAQKAANLAAHQQLKAVERQDALHSLYVDAHSFITSFEDLEKAIAEEFTDDKFSSQRTNAQSIWDVAGPQPTVARRLEQLRGSDAETTSRTSANATLSNKRVLRIAEELTGGRMSTEA